MTGYFLTALLVMALVSAAAVFAAVVQGKRIKRLEADNEALNGALGQVRERAGRLQQALGETAKVGEEADAERKNLGRASDADLVGRANGLFVQDGGAGNNPAGDAGGVATAPSGTARSGNGTV